MTRIGLATLATCAVTAGTAMAECGGDYTVQSGDSLSVIADSLYDDAYVWTRLHTENIARVGEDPNRIDTGVTLRLPCINGKPRLSGDAPQAPAVVVATLPDLAPNPAPEPEPGPAAPEPVARTAVSLLDLPEPAPIRLVTGDDFAPFTDRGLMGNGLMAEVVETALSESVGPEGFDTFWINDWASHLDPLLTKNALELAFPWSRPDCEANPGEPRCASFAFSDPMFEYLILLFVNSARPIPFVEDSDLEGRMICRPDGYPTHMMDKNGRNWVREGRVILIQPYKVNDCFRLLDEGEVDAVILNEFTARTAIADLGLADRIEAVSSRPIAVTGLHVLAHKSNPRAQQMLEAVNAGLRAIKSDGRYDQIVARHMERIWARF